MGTQTFAYNIQVGCGGKEQCASSERQTQKKMKHCCPDSFQPLFPSNVKMGSKLFSKRPLKLLLLLLIVLPAASASWFDQQFYSTADCTRAPIAMAAGFNDQVPCVSEPCTNTVEGPRVVQCPSGEPDVPFPNTVQTWQQPGCSGQKLSVSGYASGCQTTANGGSQRFTCLASGAVLERFSDASCTIATVNDTIATTPPNQCVQGVLLSCHGSTILIQWISSILVLALCFMWSSSS